MKTVVVLLQFKTGQHYDWTDVAENTVFGEGTPYATANDFLNAVKDMHKKHSFAYKIKNVIIG